MVLDVVSTTCLVKIYHNYIKNVDNSCQYLGKVFSENPYSLQIGRYFHEATAHSVHQEDRARILGTGTILIGFGILFPVFVSIFILPTFFHWFTVSWISNINFSIVFRKIS